MTQRRTINYISRPRSHINLILITGKAHGCLTIDNMIRVKGLETGQIFKTVRVVTEVDTKPRP